MLNYILKWSEGCAVLNKQMCMQHAVYMCNLKEGKRDTKWEDSIADWVEKVRACVCACVSVVYTCVHVCVCVLLCCVYATHDTSDLLTTECLRTCLYELCR